VPHERVDAGSALPLDRRRARLRARPSGLKGRCRDRRATGLRPALNPGASTALNAPWHGQTQGAARRARGADPKQPRSNPYNQSLYDFRGLPSEGVFGLP
jgi:hypothetical protein